MSIQIKRQLAGALALSLSLGLAACGGMPQNRSLYSVKQPVVERSTVALDVNTDADGLSISEQQRLAAWFQAMDLRYGDRVAVEDPQASPTTRAAVAKVAGRYGLLLSDSTATGMTGVAPGQARVTITRSSASVPGCPDWSVKTETNLTNGISPNFGCATNSNLAAMVANPEDLIKGQEGSPDTYVNTSTKAINAYQEKAASSTASGAGTSGGGTSGGQ
ncbi:pilus assembly protein CpaD [Porphyrobacter algicida]|uniref:Pilus assembly protein CpaD n=1 Tax=Qipengyuania algicida TaxID=1836209 RepID=A0A845AFH7_9SPHN|nr:CpaD family pilus assembly protein [Qipengyuania algicida]MXP27555.1 pilus assembly protein CpaD [Qipengyuania algicida]